MCLKVIRRAKTATQNTCGCSADGVGLGGEKVQAYLTQGPSCPSGWLPLFLQEPPGFLPSERQDLTLGRCVFLLTGSLPPSPRPSALERQHNPPAHHPATGTVAF